MQQGASSVHKISVPEAFYKFIKLPDPSILTDGKNLKFNN